LKKAEYIFFHFLRKTFEHRQKTVIFRQKLQLFRFLTGILLVLIAFLSSAQVKTTGTPFIRNYPKTVYEAGTQNWGIAQDKNGFIYFANNDGVLRFDGIHWDLIEIYRSAPVRSVAVDRENRVFVGLNNDFGLLQQNETGPPFFQSLRHLLPDPDIQFDDIWKIHELPQGIVFQSFDYLFLLSSNKIEVIKPETRFLFSFNVNGRLFLHEPEVGLFEYINGMINKVPWAGDLKNTEIWSILEIKDNQLLIGTRNNGIYKFENGVLDKWDTPATDLIGKNKLFSASKIMDSHFVFGTILDGIVVTDAEGNILQHINRDRGLQNNTVLSVFSDSKNNLWLGLDNGVDYIEINSPLSFFTENEGLGTGYCAEVFNDKLYLGTNQGLYVKSFDRFSEIDEPFRLVQNTIGQVWSLEIFEDQLICGHNSGTFVVQDNAAVKISDEEGAWKYIRFKNHPELLLGGHYNGLVLLQKSANGWTFFKKVKGFSESSRFIFEDDNGIVWISHGGKGIFRVRLNETKDSVTNYRLYTEAHGLPSNENNILFSLQNQFYVSGIDGIYTYHEASDSFKITSQFEQLASLGGQLLTLETDESDNIWFIAQNESGVLRRNEDLNYTKITAPFKQLDNKYVNGFEFVCPYSTDHVFFGLDNGFAHYSSKILKSYSEEFECFITKVEMPSVDSTIYFNPNHLDAGVEVPFRKNAFRFHFAAPFYENPEQLQFSYFLENYSERWSDWTTDSYRDFTNLPEGDYTLKAKAKNIYGVESEVAAFGFTVLPPWHRSQLAWFTYFILSGLLIFFIFKYVRYRIELSRKREILKHEAELQKKEEQFQHQALVADKEIVRLRNEKLRNEMMHRDKELANQTMNIIQKNKFLVKLKEELHHAMKNTSDAQLKTKLSALNQRINREIDNKQQNQIFETYFDEVHEDFFQRLKQQFPNLSPRDTRLCAYIRMNLTSKEIAALLNISDRGVEIGRYRLRKKLDLPREINLSTFLSNI
jgi:ligand-binding sensor domain-containing protein/DNA-binding CsgD family transcriptional regulator